MKGARSERTVQAWIFRVPLMHLQLLEQLDHDAPT